MAAEENENDTKKKAYSKFDNEIEYLDTKVIIVGQAGAGKTALNLRMAKDTFSPTYIATMGFNSQMKMVDTSWGKRVRFQIWDTVGQEDFAHIIPTYFRNANVVLLVFDLTNKESFSKLSSRWIAEVVQHVEPNALRVLVGCKHDLVSDKNPSVSKEAIKKLAKQLNVEYFITSAKNEKNIPELLDFLVVSCVARGLGSSPRKVNIAGPSIQRKHVFSMQDV